MQRFTVTADTDGSHYGLRGRDGNLRSSTLRGGHSAVILKEDGTCAAYCRNTPSGYSRSSASKEAKAVLLVLQKARGCHINLITDSQVVLHKLTRIKEIMAGVS